VEHFNRWRENRKPWEEPLEFAITALVLGMVTVDEVQAATVARRQARPLIGELAIKNRRLSIHEVFQILGEQATTGEPFGEAAVRMGLLDAKGLNELLGLQTSVTPQLSEVLVEQGVLTRDDVADLRRQVRERMQKLAQPEMAGMAEG
jgi:hypothetical protein